MERKDIGFETGKIGPRWLNFDHHGSVDASNGFIVKMASVQLMEFLAVSGTSIKEYNVIFNHYGHLDDFVAKAILGAEEHGKMRSLYEFASTVQAVDTLGPVGYKLLPNNVHKIVVSAYDAYSETVRNIANEIKKPTYQVPLEDKAFASALAGSVIISLLEEDELVEREIWEPKTETYNRPELSNKGVLTVGMNSTQFNPLRASEFLFNQNPDAIVIVSYMRMENGKMFYSICCRSVYHEDLSGLWDMLSRREYPHNPKNTWGGHPGAGGSPRGTNNNDEGSTLRLDEVLNVLNKIR